MEVNRPNRQRRRRHGKSDPVDALAAARSAQAGDAVGEAKTRSGAIEAIRALRVARRSAVHGRTSAINQMRALLVSGPSDLRERLRGSTVSQLVTAATRLRPADPTAVVGATQLALRELARRVLKLEVEFERLDAVLRPLVATTAPDLVASLGGFCCTRVGSSSVVALHGAQQYQSLLSVFLAVLVLRCAWLVCPLVCNRTHAPRAGAACVRQVHALGAERRRLAMGVRRVEHGHPRAAHANAHEPGHFESVRIARHRMNGLADQVRVGPSGVPSGPTKRPDPVFGTRGRGFESLRARQKPHGPNLIQDQGSPRNQGLCSCSAHVCPRTKCSWRGPFARVSWGWSRVRRDLGHKSEARLGMLDLHSEPWRSGSGPAFSGLCAACMPALGQTIMGAGRASRNPGGSIRAACRIRPSAARYSTRRALPSSIPSSSGIRATSRGSVAYEWAGRGCRTRTARGSTIRF